ncbi:MAG: type II toxin-antitoxin system VapC family toxin [Acidobacteria bacterium]|nr:type II toxin-antitoxin system VapC family toxin [Acidobacteriota bacterium]
MSRLLLDTSGYSAFLRGHEGLKRSLQNAEQIFLNAVVLGELRAGFIRSQRRRQNEDELTQFLSSPRVGVVGMDENTADCYAAILDSLRIAGTPIPTNDVWIAASAMEFGLRVLTTDTHFVKVAQVLVDYVEVR